jgi:multidrug efflux pump subunit AcrA (membrane-fusion protein)
MRLTALLILLAALVLTACGAGGEGAVPTVVLGGGATGNAATQPAPQFSGGEVTASGVVVPAQEAQLGFPLAGTVRTVHVSDGDQVEAGDVLVELDNSDLQMQVAQAERALRELTSPAAVAAAEQALVNTQEALDDAQDKRDSYNYNRATQEQVENAQANLVLAEDTLDEAHDAYQKFKNNPPDDPRRAQAFTAYYAAVNARDRAKANLNWLVGGPSESDVALADANLDAALAAQQEAQWYLSELKGETVPADATGAQLAQLQQARDSLKAAQDQLARTRLLAPFAGTMATVDIVPGEYVLPGQALLAISDLADLKIETSDLSELDVPDVSVGEEVSVQIKALGELIPGHVVSISPVATTLGVDVVYMTTIALDSIPEGLRAGMSATVNYAP